jgi:thiol-disulfide isomerase/thioredoxin
MTANPSDSASTVSPGTRFRNFLIVAAAIALSVALFLGLRTENTAVSLTALAQNATPLEVALTNGKPTLLEFYANWCTSCQAMAPEIAKLEEQYAEQVNFVMLNVDNTKWLPEILHFRVDGIPHFVFMDRKGDAIASTIGEQPRPILTANLDALTAGESLPYLQSGQISRFSAPMESTAVGDDPRSHGAQVTQ